MTLERPTIDLSGKTALVTGATGALGRAMARTLALCGADVALHYHRNAPMAETLKGEIEAMGRR
ncbi:MAG TPA: SDR family NAD(P)-dependent oxidoreductase, partial [Armatimonadota bacterium]|nr:SDR family NAD(P)-dependent oxidoreductase [Armatimonadota bacterium]